MYRQYKLRSGDAELVTWLDHEPPLRVDQTLTLEGSPTVWTVVEAGVIALGARPDQQWKVGGVDAGRRRPPAPFYEMAPDYQITDAVGASGCRATVSQRWNKPGYPKT